MTLPKISNDLKFRIQKIGTVLAPPLTASLCLLAGLDLFYVAVLAIAVAFPASLYNRRLYAYTEGNRSDGRQDLGIELLEDRPNVVVYKTQNGAQIIGFYKITQRPQRQFLHTLNSRVANSKLVMSLIDNVNGTFLVIRFPSKGFRNPRRLIRNAGEHLETLSGVITQHVPGLKLEPASVEELRSLTGLLGLAITKKTNHQVSKEFDEADLTSNQEKRDFSDFQPVKKSLREPSPLSEYSYPEIEKNPPEINDEVGQSRESTNTRAEVNEEAPVRTMESSPQIISLISRIDEASETGESLSLNLLTKSDSKSGNEQSFTQEEIQARDSGITSVTDEKTLLKPPQPIKTPQRSFNQFKKDLKPKKLTLEQYIGENVRENRQSSTKNSPLTPSSTIVMETSGNSNQENEKRTVEPRQSIASNQQQHSNIPSGNNDKQGLDDHRVNVSHISKTESIQAPVIEEEIKMELTKVSKPQLADGHHFAEVNAKIIAKLKDLHRNVTPTVEGLVGDEKDIVLSQTGKRVAGRLVVRDLIEILEIADDLKECPTHIKGIIAGLRQYIVEQLWMSVEEDMDPRELWNRIPGAVKIVGILLKNLNESQPAHSEQYRHHQEERTPSLPNMT